MSKLRIFIEGKELDSLESVTVPITKQFEELSDPTVICNDYSKTVTVPLSKNNNDIFGHCYNPDRLIATADDDTIPLVGIYFDPYKKLDCRLQWGDDVFFVGYAKMLKVTNSGYEVTINGELGKIFQELQKITFDKTKYEDEDDIAKYWIDGSKYVNTTINKDLVYNCWNSKQDDHILRETTDPNYDITDIIGFIPNNSFSDDFDYNSWEIYNSDENRYETQSFEDYLNTEQFGGNQTFQNFTGISTESIIGDGLLPEQMREWRSYNQIPFIYWNKFWQIFQKKAEELTGYTWELDENWFDTQNYFYQELGTTLLNRNQIIKNNEDVKDDNFVLKNYSSNIFRIKPSSINSYNYIGLQSNTGNLVIDNYFQVKDGTIILNLQPTLQFSVLNDTGYKGTSFGFSYATGSNNIFGGLRFQISYGDVADQNIIFDSFFIDNSDAATKIYKKYFPNTYLMKISQQKVSVENNQRLLVNIELEDSIYLYLKSEYGNKPLFYKITPWALSNDYDKNFVTADNVFVFGTSDGYKFPDTTAYLNEMNQAASTDITWRKTFFRSDDNFTLNDICNFDFSNILDYCKRFRINIYTDEANKRLVFTKTLFDNYSVVDKTDKIDRSSTFDISPVTFDKKNILFSYTSEDTQLGKSYYNMFNSKYGEKKIITDYNFNDDEEVLFEKSKESLIYTPSYIYWNKIAAQYPKVVFEVYNNIFIDVRDSDNKTVDSDFMYFFPTKKLIQSEVITYISDDSDLMKQLNLYNYLNTKTATTSIITFYWTTPSLLYDTDICLFLKPKKIYTLTNWAAKGSDIYEQYWEKYINERYNIQNKKVTTYVRITPSDFINFKFNQFWKIDNQIYIVNKIYDYDITSDKPTKVDLITVQDISAYLSGLK